MPTHARRRRNGSFPEFAHSTTKTLHAPRIHKYAAERFWWAWDEPLRLLTVSSADAITTLPLDSLHSCAAALSRLDDRSVVLLTDALTDAVDALKTWRGVPPWPAAVGDAISLLLMFVIAAKETKRHERLVRAAKNVVPHLTANGPSGAWYAAFHQHLPFAHRAGVLAAAAERSVSIGVADLLWWTAKCRLDLAIEWAAALRIDDGEAVREVVDAASAYVRLLQDEPCRRAMERFYAACGTTSEAEVLRAHSVREEHTTGDEVARAEVMTWLLRRYALRETWQLLRRTMRPREWIGACLAAALAIAGVVTFGLQGPARMQVALQMGGFVALVWLSPRVFALALPRALFGTLLAWTTVVVAQSASLLPITGADSESLRRSCHTWLTNVIAPQRQLGQFMTALRQHQPVRLSDLPDVFDFSGIVVVGLAISSVFLAVEVSDRLATRAIHRSIVCVLVMLVGSLFWGAMLVPTLQYIVTPHGHSSACRCALPALFLGSVCAVAFGILVQLIWDDRAVSESIGVPAASAR